MIKREDLKDGMTVWYGNLVFTTGRSIRNYPATYRYPVTGTLKIENSVNGKMYVVLDNNNTLILSRIPSKYYGTTLSNSLYSSREDILVDWNRVLQTELDRRKELLRKSEQYLQLKFHLDK